MPAAKKQKTADGATAPAPAGADYVPQNVLITGGAGFIASHVALRFAKRYPRYNVVVVDKLDYCANLNNLREIAALPNFKFVKADVGSADLMTYVMREEQIDTVMHFAAQSHVDNSFGNSYEFTKNNIEGTHALLEACVRARRPNSSDSCTCPRMKCTGKISWIQTTERASLLTPTNPYAATKAGAEMLVMAYGRSYGLPYIITRGNNVYGPNQYPEKAIPKFSILAKRGEKISIHGDGRRDAFVHARRRRRERVRRDFA